MLTREIEIVNKLGLHTRAAAKLVSTAGTYQCEVSLSFSGQDADAKSIMAVMMLAAAKGSIITIACDGDDEIEALQALVDLIEDYFGEED